MASELIASGNKPVRDNNLPRRSFAPVHHVVEITSVTTLLELDTYESNVFEAGGHKWSLCLHPKGHKDHEGKVHMSLYLLIEDKLKENEEVEVNYKFFVYDFIHKNYVTFQEKDKELRAFSKGKTQWGLSKFLSLGSFTKPQYGYRQGEYCQFGAEVLVSKPKRKKETFTIIRDPPPHTTTGKIRDFTWNKNYPNSDLFAAGGHNWKLKVGPRASGDQKWLYVRLSAQDLPRGIKMYAKAELRVLNKNNPDNYREGKVSGWMSATNSNCCNLTFMLWGDLEKGRFVKNKKLEFRVRMLVISKVPR